MTLGIIANSDQLTIMARVLGAYCKHGGITNQVEIDSVAGRIVALYEMGVTEEDELLAALILPPRRMGGKAVIG